MAARVRRAFLNCRKALINQPRYADESDWTPLLYPYQQNGANVLYFTFIDPRMMVVPLAFRKLGNIREIEIVSRFKTFQQKAEVKTQRGQSLLTPPSSLQLAGKF